MIHSGNLSDAVIGTEFVLFVEDDDDSPSVVITVPADAGDPDLVYVYEPVSAQATPTP